jgi:peptide/nickel transport system permease protein
MTPTENTELAAEAAAGVAGATATVPAPGATQAAPGTLVTHRGRHPVFGFLGRRLAAGLATLLVASFFIFFATNVLPGNVAQVVLGKNATPENVRVLEAKLHLNRSFMWQYSHWLGGVVTGDFGQSSVQIAQGATSAPVASEIATPARNSAILAGLTILFMIPLSMVLGVIASVRVGKVTDHAISMTSLVIGAFPEFVFGTLLILVFFSELHLLPPVALLAPGQTPLDNIKVLILPIATLLGVTLAAGIRQVRAGMVDVLQRDYVALARINGLSARRVLWRYALRNALATSVQITAQNIQYLMGGIIVVESVFNYPGLGSFLVSAVATRDVAQVEAIALLLAALYILINIIADLIVVFLVPKLRTGMS